MFRSSLEVLPELWVSKQSMPSGAGVSLTINYSLSPSVRDGFPRQKLQSENTPGCHGAPRSSYAKWLAGWREEDVSCLPRLVPTRALLSSPQTC